MATIKKLLEREKRDFKLAINGEYEVNGKSRYFSDMQKKFIKDAISSIDYVLSVLEGKIKLPNENADLNSSEGKVYGYLCGSIVNITMAESFLYEKWGNIETCFFDDGYPDRFDEYEESDFGEEHRINSEADYEIRNDDFDDGHSRGDCSDCYDLDEGLNDCCDL